MRHVITLLLAVSGILSAQKPDLAGFGHGEGRFKKGDMAPDFRLKRLRASDETSLSSFRGKKPVALVFGSYT